VAGGAIAFTEVTNDSASPATHPSVAVYTPARLALYDPIILGFSCRFVWRCPKHRFLDLYDRHVGARHLDVGVGTGYFLDHCRFPVERPAITLLDLSGPCLAKAAQRLDRYSPRVVRANVLDQLDLGEAQFDSIALNGVLHCVPGTMEEKAAVFRNLRPFVAEGGVLFGSTILGQGVDHTRLARAALRVYNRERIFTNLEDDRASLERALAGSFSRHETETEGSFALFAARS
jgi:SAM-dependent methyltransferase